MKLEETSDRYTEILVKSTLSSMFNGGKNPRWKYYICIYNPYQGFFEYAYDEDNKEWYRELRDAHLFGSLSMELFLYLTVS